MKNDKDNLFMFKIKEMVKKYFTDSKKFLIEKNAKLEVTYKMRQKI